MMFGIGIRAFADGNEANPDDLNFRNTVDKNAQRSREHKQEIADGRFPKHPQHPYDQFSDDNAFKVSFVDDENAHFRTQFYVDTSRPKFEDYTMPHTIWSKEEMDGVQIIHKKPERIPDKLAYFGVLTLRTIWDLSTGYTLSRLPVVNRFFRFSPNMVLLRMVFLETVAGVPGMMFGMVRHLNSLRRMERDRGWIKTLLSEAENERMHLLVAMSLYKPGRFWRGMVLLAQGLFCNFLFVAYLLSPRFCHSFVGYLEEQAVVTYTHILDGIDAGEYPEFQVQASELAIKYWKLPKDAVWRDVFAAMRADEANHRDVNHTLSGLADDPKAVNPYRRKT